MLNDKVIVITGGAGHIGREFVRAVVENNGIAIIADINEDFGRETQEKINAELETNSVDFIRLDITSKESLQECINFTTRKYNRIDALVNNAYPCNSNYGAKLEDVEYVDFCENLNMHLGGYFLSSQFFASFFSEQGYGNIVNVSSIYGSMAPRFEVYKDTSMTMPVEYAAIKSAINQLTRYFAQYFKEKSIRVNSLSPGGIYNNQPKEFLEKYNKFCAKKGMLDCADIAPSLIFLLSDASINITGQNLIIDDGYSL